jgi:hypothetical protein
MAGGAVAACGPRELPAAAPALRPPAHLIRNSSTKEVLWLTNLEGSGVGSTPARSQLIVVCEDCAAAGAPTPAARTLPRPLLLVPPLPPRASRPRAQAPTHNGKQ